MINSVRSTVLAVLNKENRGYISPDDFNLFAKQAQLEVFEEYFEEYTNWVTKSLTRRSHSDYGDIPKLLREKIDVFSDYGNMSYDNTSKLFNPPTNLYRLNSVVYNGVEIEEVYKSQINYLYTSDLTAPTTYYPMCIKLGNKIEVHPNTITSGVKCYYIRKPKDPKWTYINTPNAIFNQSATDYQDFEIHPSDEAKIVLKILEYSGLSIKETDINKILQEKEIVKTQTETR